MKKTLIAFCFLFLSSVAYAETLVISQDISVDYETPAILAHSGDQVIFKYDDWSFSHSVVNPKTLYPAVDLTGLDHDFIVSIFVPASRNSLPPWLALLAQEQAHTFGLELGKVKVKTLSGGTIYAIYSMEAKEGNIFVLEEQKIHHFQMLGAQVAFQRLLNNIKDR